MSLRPVAARWFEVLTLQSDTARALGVLARTGAVELEPTASDANALPLESLADGISAFRELLARYARYWNRGDLRRTDVLRAPAEVLADSLTRIEAWRKRADPIIDRLQALEEERTRLGYWKLILECARHRALDFRDLTGTGPVLGTLFAILPSAR